MIARNRLNWLGMLVLGMALSAPSHAGWFFVSPEGDDDNTGHSVDEAFESIEVAVKQARAGDTVMLLPGTYRQVLRTERDGSRGEPIRIQGTRDSVLVGERGAGRIVEVRHSFIELSGFSVNGRDPKRRKKDVPDKLVYVGSDDDPITGVRLIGMLLRNAGNECVRFRGSAHDNEVAYNEIDGCGLNAFKFGGRGKNGEAIYLGTAPEQMDDGGRDHTDGNHIHDNSIVSRGSECVDVKEGARFNLIEYNVCRDQVDPDSAGISIRGSQNVVRYNVIGPTEGAGIRVGGDEQGDARRNRIYANQLSNNKAGALKLMDMPQTVVCGNEIRQPAKYAKVRGVVDQDFDAERGC